MRLGSLLRIELAKLRRQRLAVTTVAVPVVAGVLLPQLIWIFGGDRAASQRGFYVYTWSVQLALLMGVYLLVLQAALSVVVDRHEKTLRNTLVAPVRRGGIIAVRWLALQAVALLLLGLLAGGAFVSTAIHFEFGSVYEEAIEPLADAQELRVFTLIGLAKLILPLAAVVSVGMLVSVLTATPATAAGLALGTLLLLDVVKSIAPATSSFRRYLFNSYLPTFFDESSYWHGVTAYAQGITDVLWMADAPEHGYGTFIPLGTLLACFGLSFVVFSRGEYSE